MFLSADKQPTLQASLVLVSKPHDGVVSCDVAFPCQLVAHPPNPCLQVVPWFEETATFVSFHKQKLAFGVLECCFRSFELAYNWRVNIQLERRQPRSIES